MHRIINTGLLPLALLSTLQSAWAAEPMPQDRVYKVETPVEEEEPGMSSLNPFARVPTPTAATCSVTKQSCSTQAQGVIFTATVDIHVCREGSFRWIKPPYYSNLFIRISDRTNNPLFYATLVNPSAGGSYVSPSSVSLNPSGTVEIRDKLTHYPVFSANVDCPIRYSLR